MPPASGPTVVYDACVLYPSVLRSALVSLAGAGLFRARWTHRIYEEWIAALLRNRPDLSRERLSATRDAMDRAVPDALVAGWEAFEPALAAALPDAGDAHVVAAARSCGASLIVTKNLRHFPAAVLGKHGIGAQHPDRFIARLIDLDAHAVCQELCRERERWRRPPATVDEFLDAIERQELPLTAAALRTLAAFL